jgi:CheY-like chemotaxis protein
MDLTMPELDGVEAARQIRTRHVLSQTPIFAISGYTSREIKADAQAAGCNAVFGQPLDLDELLGRIRATLGV